MEFEFKKVKVGSVVTGKIFQVDENAVHVDVNAMYEAVIYKQFLGLKDNQSCKKFFKEGEELHAKVSKIDHENQKIYLSRMDIIRQAQRKEFNEFAEANAIEARVKRVVRGGLVLNYDGIELFMPASQIDIKKVELDDFKDKTLRCVVIENNGNKVVVSRRKVLEKELRENKQKELETFNVGQVIESEIASLNDRGANVKLGYNYGFIHISEISHHHVKKVEDFLAIGQKVKAEIINIDKRGIKLSLKKLQETPWAIYAKENKVGDKVPGKIVRKMADAMLVEVAKDVVGIINKRDYSWDPNINYAGEVEVGSEVELKILNIDVKRRKMSLSKKHLEYNPWQDVTVKLGEEVSGEVSEFQSNGALVKIQGVDAFLPIGEIVDKRINDPKEVLTIGEVVNAVVTKVDTNNWRMSISIKQLEANKERKEFEEYLKTEEEVKATTLGDLFKDKLDKFKK